MVLDKSDVTTLTLVLGADGLAVRKPSTGTASAKPTPKPKPIDAHCID